MIILERMASELRAAQSAHGPAAERLMSLSGRRVGGRRAMWTIGERSLRSLSFPNRIVQVQCERIEGFVVVQLREEVFALLVRGTFALPTRIWQPGEHPNGGRAEYTPQDMEIGVAFRSIPHGELISNLRSLGYAVTERTWNSYL